MTNFSFNVLYIPSVSTSQEAYRILITKTKLLFSCSNIITVLPKSLTQHMTHCMNRIKVSECLKKPMHKITAV